MAQTGSIEFHFDGDIIQNHEIPLHVLTKTLISIEGSINRAHLVAKHGNAIKHRRMTADDYEQVKLWIGKAKDGGYILKLAAATQVGKNAIKKVMDTMVPFVDSMAAEMEVENNGLKSQVNTQKQLLAVNEQQNAMSYRELLRQEEQQDRYIIKSILKEYDELLTFISNTDKFGSNTLELTFSGDQTVSINFTPEKAKTFKKILKKKSIGNPVHYRGAIRYLNINSLTANFRNAETKKSSTLKLIDEDDYLKVHPFAVPDREIRFIGSPVLEYNSFDAIGGDIYFLALEG